MSNKEAPYFQFPLQLLRMDLKWPELVETIVAVGCAYAANNDRSLSQGDPPIWDIGLGVLEDLFPNNGCWDIECVQIGHGAEILGIRKFDNPYDYLIEAAELLRHAIDFLGCDPLLRVMKETQVRLRVDIILSGPNRGLSEREARILAAIFSCIGSADKRLITISTIRARMLGYASVMEMEQDKSLVRNKLLSDSQIRTTIKNLHRLGFFARATIKRRFTYYSIRMDEKDLRNLLVGNSSLGTEFEAHQRVENEEMNKKIKEKKERIGGSHISGSDP